MSVVSDLVEALKATTDELQRLAGVVEYEQKANFGLVQANRALAKEVQELVITNSLLQAEVNNYRIVSHMEVS
jgi:hypothetical protein